jgi:hypothetical protein
MAYRMLVSLSHSHKLRQASQLLDIMRKNLVFLIICCVSHHELSESYTPKIVGGFNVTSFQGFRHQVSIRDASHESSRFGSGHLCGGSLIDYDTVRRNFFLSISEKKKEKKN